MTQTFDVIIIGAGSVGVPAACSISAAGYRVLVIDNFSSIGQGSNKCAIGGVRATHSNPAKARLCQQSIEIFKHWNDEYGDDINWVDGGYCFVAYTPEVERTLKSLLIEQKKLGLNIDWLDSQALLDSVPGLNPAGLLGGTLSPEDGNCSPLLALHAFYNHACASGAIFQFDEKVTSLIITNGKIKGLITDKAQYSAEIVINAAGAWANQIGVMTGDNLRVRPNSHEAGITEAVAPFLKPMIVDTHPEPGSSDFYYYQAKTGQIIFCVTPQPHIWGYDIAETSGYLPQVAKRLIDIMPKLQNIRVRRTWRGLYPMTPDGNPMIGESRNTRGLIHAVGMCGQGFMLGPGVGELLLRIITNQLTKDDESTLVQLSPYRTFTNQEILE
jgi:sarcosine oxidase, subunit beta